MDLNTQFIVDHSRYFTESRIASGRAYGYGNGSRAATMIAGMAAGVRRAASTIERWARGTNAEIAEHRLPKLTSVR